MNKQSDLISRLQDEADLCRNEGADDIAMLLDESAKALAAQAGPAQAPLTDEQIDKMMREIGRKIEGHILVPGVPMHGDWPVYYRAKVRAAIAIAAKAPLTRQQIDEVMTEHYPLSSLLREEVDAFEACVRDIERRLGIGAQAPASTRPADASISGQAGEFLPLLLRDLCRELEASVPDACAALRDAGLGESGQGSAVTPAMASVLRQRFVAAEEAARDWRMLFDEMQTYTDSLKLELDALRSAAAPQAPAEQPLMLNGLSEAETAQTASVAGLTVAPAEPAALAVGRVRIDSGEVHITPMVRDPDQSPLRDGQMVYATPAAREAGTTAGN